MMSVGLHQVSLLAGGNEVPGWMIGMHAHLGMLSIIAIVTGFAADAFAIAGILRHAVTGLYLLDQWPLPGPILAGEGMGLLVVMPTMFPWGLCLIVAILSMAWQAATATHGDTGHNRMTTPADD